MQDAEDGVHAGRTRRRAGWYRKLLGIDPGSRVTGYGVIDMDGQRAVHVASGCLRVADLGTLGERLRAVYDGVNGIINHYRPSEMAVEMVFMNRNVDSALKLGQARGAAIVAGAKGGLSLHEFTPTQIKQAVVGRGHADKVQVQHMVRVLLCLSELPPPDAADALAVAICHGHVRQGLLRMAGISGSKNGRYL